MQPDPRVRKASKDLPASPESLARLDPQVPEDPPDPPESLERTATLESPEDPAREASWDHRAHAASLGLPACLDSKGFGDTTAWTA